jgi:hypothetical protein
MATYHEVMQHAIITVGERKKQEYKRKLESIDDEVANLIQFDWSPLRKFLLDEKNQYPGITGKTGTYFIFYSNDDLKTSELFYIGQGTISERRANHKSIFLNEGNPCSYYTDSENPSKITSQIDSVIARKMYNKDPNREHWYMMYKPSPKSWAPEIEAEMISMCKPSGNDEKMSGKS